MLRIPFLVLAAAMLLATAPPVPANAADTLTIIEPYGAGSATDRIAELLKPALEKQTGRAVKVDHAGEAALDRVAAAAPDGNTVLVIALLPPELNEATGTPGTKLSALTPIAKLTGPASVALVVPQGSPIKTWADFAAAAKARPLSIASPGRINGAGIPIAFMERVLKVHFTDVMAATHDDILDALAKKRADAGFLVTLTLLPGIMAGPPVHPIVTFGGQRNPNLSEVPTFRELIGPQTGEKQHDAITSAIALFGPAGMPPETIKKLVADFSAAAVTAKQGTSIVAKRVPLDVGDAALLNETMARDKAVIKELLPLLH